MPKTEENHNTKCGFIAIVGAPNVGKSTLLNRLVGVKVSIVSQKIQTTRTRILGICVRGKAQLVFIDTPGIFQPRQRLERAMVAAAWMGARDADHIALMVDATLGLDSNTNSILERFKKEGIHADLILNKVDLVEKLKLLKLAARLNDWDVFDKTFMISAKKGDGINDLMLHFTEKLPNGPWMFPKDQVSNLTDRLIAAEITREKIFQQLYKELPYSTTVETEKWKILKDTSIRIDQVIYTQRDSQKAIILGKKGNQIKSIGVEARAELERIFDCHVQLFLFVKVRENWRDDPERYREWGLDFNA